jgi:hypothetical protein
MLMFQVTRRRFIQKSPFTLAALLAPGPARAAPSVKRLVFDISRNGAKIGVHQTTITRDGGKTTLDTQTNVQVKVAFITAYTYEFLAQEIWLDMHFDSFVSSTDDNGDKHQVRMDAKGGKLAVTADGKSAVAPPNAIPGSFWNAQLMRSGPIMMIETGQILQVTIKLLGQEPGPQGRKLDHFKVTGGLERDIWFDGQTPVRYQLKTTRDGSIIESRLRP